MQLSNLCKFIFFNTFYRVIHLFHFLTLNFFKCSNEPVKEKKKKQTKDPEIEKKKSEEKTQTEDEGNQSLIEEEEEDEFNEDLEKDDIEKKPWRKEIWELAIWDYQEIPMIFFCFFNPIHVLILYWFHGNYTIVIFAFLYSFTVRIA